MEKKIKKKGVRRSRRRGRGKRKEKTMKKNVEAGEEGANFPYVLVICTEYCSYPGAFNSSIGMRDICPSEHFLEKLLVQGELPVRQMHSTPV